MHSQMSKTKKSNSKYSLNHSPYEERSRLSCSISTGDIKFGSPIITRTAKFDSFPEVKRFKEFCRNITGKTDQTSPNLANSKHFEGILQERLEKLHKKGQQSFSELEVIENLYSEIISSYHDLKNTLDLLRQKTEEYLTRSINEKFSKEIEGLKKSNNLLIVKMNTLSKINNDLKEENEKLKEKQVELDRLFGDDPQLLIKYNNIVDRMQKQVKIIDALKKEIRNLRGKKKTNNSQSIGEFKPKQLNIEDSFLLF